MTITVRNGISKSKGTAKITSAALGLRAAEIIDPRRQATTWTATEGAEEVEIEIEVREDKARGTGRWVIIAEAGASDTIEYQPGAQRLILAIDGGVVVR